MKGIVFEIMFTLLRDDETSIYFAFGVSLIQYLQIYYSQT